MPSEPHLLKVHIFSAKTPGRQSHAPKDSNRYEIWFIQHVTLNKPTAIPSEKWYNRCTEAEERIAYRKANDGALYMMR